MAGELSLKHCRAGVLDVSYRDEGSSEGPVVMLLHGFPYDIHAFDRVVELLVAQGVRCIVPFLRGYGDTRFLDPATPRSGEQAALGFDLLTLMDALSIDQAILAGYDWGGRAACVVSALWPERVKGLVSCGNGYNIQNIARAGEPVAAEQEHRFWYQYYFHSERGREGLRRDRDGVCRLLWRLWSPDWRFDDATFAQSSGSFGNADFIDVVIHSYRHRFGLVPGDPAMAAIEARLARQPPIPAPTIVLQGQGDGVDPPAAAADDTRFTGSYERRNLNGVGHNVPQEAPHAFCDAVLALIRASA